jgi:hypothetical protein
MKFYDLSKEPYLYIDEIPTDSLVLPLLKCANLNYQNKVRIKKSRSFILNNLLMICFLKNLFHVSRKFSDNHFFSLTVTAIGATIVL